MPTKRVKKGRNPAKPWHARVKYRTNTYSFGYYATKEEAKAVEDEFRKEVGSNSPIPNATQYERIMELRNQGLTNREIAIRLDRTRSGIRSAIARGNSIHHQKARTTK
jgi:DNA-binding NarL/FixJ family response regulator